MMRNILKRAGRILAIDPVKRRETAYLNEATSLVDLEMRMRDIDRGRFRGTF